MKKAISIIKELLMSSFTSTLELFKVMIPIIILLKFFQELGWVKYLAFPLEPVMSILGLPPEMGLVWATTIINNIYTGIIVLTSLSSESTISTAQATVLGVLMLVAHGLPIECAIARKSGARVLFQCATRLLGSFAFAWCLHIFYSKTGTLQQSAVMLLPAESSSGADITYLTWALDQATKLGTIFFIILSLMTIMRFLQFIKVIELMNYLLRPLLNLIGIGPKASAITVIGLTMGLSYGGGLIINEAKNGSVSTQDIFYSLTLMGLCHSLIEDTLLIALIGGHLSGVLWTRLIFSIFAMAIIVQIVQRLPRSFQTKYLWVPINPIA